MNFKAHEKKIRKLLVLPEKRASKTKPNEYRYQYKTGVYVISEKLDDEHHKIGMAFGSGGLFNRLKSYKICWPFKDTYFLQYVFICDSKNARILEKKILARTDKLKHVEEAQACTDCGGEECGKMKDEGKHSLEWRFTAKKETLNATLIDELNNNPTLWQYAVIFGAKSWKIIKSPQKLTNFQRPASSRDERPMFDEGEKVDTFIPGVLNVGNFGWVVYLGRSKKLVASRGKIVGVVKGKWDMRWGSDKYEYPKEEVYATKEIALKEGQKIIDAK